MGGRVVRGEQGRPAIPQRGFLHVIFMQETGIRDPASLDSWHAYFCPPDAAGRFDDVTQALQCLVEAYPIEHLEKAAEDRFYDHLDEQLKTDGAESGFHDLLRRLAAGLGYEYRPVWLHVASVNEDEFAFLEDHYGSIDMVSAGDDLVVRVPLIFIADAQSGRLIRGRALISTGY